MKNEEILKENNVKRFSVILMNPPYSGSLHLKFLEKTIKIADNVVSIQPVRWLEEVVGKEKKKSLYNKYEESISKHIKDLEIVTAENVKKQFNILLPVNCAIYVCDNNGGFDYKQLSSNEVIDKVVNYIKENKCNFEFNKKEGYRLRIPFIVGGGKAGGVGFNRPPVFNRITYKRYCV